MNNSIIKPAKTGKKHKIQTSKNIANVDILAMETIMLIQYPP